MRRQKGPLLCTQCGKRRRMRNGELVPCDHDLSFLDGIDWQEFKDSCLREAARWRAT